MSVVIRGMEMPETSLQCEFCESGYCNKMNMRFCPGAVKRPDWCPLIELPANHGPLIDREATISALSENAYAVGKSALPMMMTLVKAINDIKRMPVIIEAEDTDENDKP